MTPGKAREVLALYREKFEDMKIPEYEFPKHRAPNRGRAAVDFNNPNYYLLAHCHGILDTVDRMIFEEKMEQVVLEIGFIQGVLWSSGLYTVEELENHIRE